MTAVLTSASQASGLDWRRTVAHVDQNGDDMERARLRGILGRPRPEAKIVRALQARQNEDGGFPYGLAQGRPSAIEATATALAWMQDLALRRSPHAERAVMYLLAAQRPDGSWDEPPALLRFNPPPCLLPGDPRVRVASTARAAFWLARAEPRSDAAARAVAYLRRHQAPDGRFVGFLSATWLAAAVCRLVDGPASDAAARGLGALSAVSPDRWYPSALAGMLGCLGDSGVPGGTPFVRSGLARLRESCRSNGSWPGDDGDPHHVEATLAALRALILYGAVSSGPERGSGAAAGTDRPGEEIPG